MRRLISPPIPPHHHFITRSPEFPESLAHLPYFKMLPKPEQLLTPLHFSEEELELFRGSHLYAATADRREVLRNEWQRCLDYLVTTPNGDMYRQRYTWWVSRQRSVITSNCRSREQYLTAATYLSSRAFPSTLISGKPSVAISKDSYPVLFPGVDSLNHARRQPVSWVVDPLPPTDPGKDLAQYLGLSLLVHLPSRPGEELLNNYGAKPNSELILGYGFSLEGNPDDTIVLSIGGKPAASAPSSGEKETWEVGRDARGIGGIWNRVLDIVSSASTPEVEESEATRFENQLDAASTLSEMCQSYLDRLPQIPAILNAPSPELRPEVLKMIAHYIEGVGPSRAIVASINFLRV